MNIFQNVIYSIDGKAAFLLTITSASVQELLIIWMPS